MTVIAVAALSARMIAEAASLDGFEVVALDLFGDRDTRRACKQWLPIGEAERLRIDGDRLLAALGEAAQRFDLAGWMIGSGFDGQPDLLARGADLLPLIGTQPEHVRRVREPQAFFGFLDSCGIEHPRVQTAAPADPTGWLVKDAGGCGGWHVRRATTAGEVGPHHYHQVEMSGTPMSATFIANGKDACVLGFNLLLVGPATQGSVAASGGDESARPFVFHGVIGPVPLAPDAGERIDDAVRRLTREFSLRGLCSLDFIFDDGRIGVLEVNPRPPASMALYSAQGVAAAHVNACLHGELAQLPKRAIDEVRGTEIVIARRAFSLDQRAAVSLAEQPHRHDLPASASHFDAGDPVCSVSASGANAAQVRASLERRREAIHDFIEAHR